MSSTIKESTSDAAINEINLTILRRIFMNIVSIQLELLHYRIFSNRSVLGKLAQCSPKVSLELAAYAR